MAIIMSMFVSFAMTVINFGFTTNLMELWMGGWAIGFFVSLPLSFLLPPLLQKIMERLKI
jgi:cytosine/uracil/thiamine/allantoin permease